MSLPLILNVDSLPLGRGQGGTAEKGGRGGGGVKAYKQEHSRARAYSLTTTETKDNNCAYL